MGAHVRGMSSNPDPYKTLNVPRDASDADIKKAYRTKAMTTHPDRNPELDPLEAQRRFAEVGNAFELLKDPSAREEFDMTGRVGGGGGGGGGGGHQGAMDMREMMLREMMRRQMRQRPPPPPPKIFPEAEMEAYISSDVASIHRASRECKIDTDRDERRAAYAGKLGMVASVDPDDRTVKVRGMRTLSLSLSLTPSLSLSLSLSLSFSFSFSFSLSLSLSLSLTQT